MNISEIIKEVGLYNEGTLNCAESDGEYMLSVDTDGIENWRITFAEMYVLDSEFYDWERSLSEQIDEQLRDLMLFLQKHVGAK